MSRHPTILQRIHFLESQIVTSLPVNQLVEVLLNRIEMTNGLEFVDAKKLELLVNRIGEHLIERAIHG